jgi:phosphotransacetylase
MLSFSTAGSALHEMVTKVQEATKKASLLLEKNNIEALIE